MPPAPGTSETALQAKPFSAGCRFVSREGAVDSLDVRILRAYLLDQSRSPIRADIRASVARIAKPVGEDEETVRYRLKKIQDSGFFADWRLYLNPHVWGGGQVTVWFGVDPAVPKADIVDRLRLVPGVLFVHAFYGRLAAFLEYEDERSLPRAIELLRQVAGAPDAFVARVAFPECQATLGPRDWDLIRGLRTNPRKPYAELAAAAGLSSQTTRARLARVVEQGVVFAWPSLNLRAVQEGVLIHLAVWYPGERKAEVDRAITTDLEPHLWHMMHMLPYGPKDLWPCSYNLFLPNLSTAREVLDWVKTVPGVERAQFDVHEDIYNFFDVYDEMLDRRLNRMPTALRPARVGASGDVPPMTQHV